jgi:hypothetical protein
MADGDIKNLNSILLKIRDQAKMGHLRLTLHAQQEMIEEDIKIVDIYQTLATCQILENYHEHQRGACCLLFGKDSQGRNIHIVCTTSQPLLIIITAYIPLPPKWITPTQRG